MTSPSRSPADPRRETSLQLGDVPIVKEDRSGPSFTFAHRLYRLVWRTVWLFLAAWTPPAFSPWRIVLLRLFGARIGAEAAVSASTKVWFPRNLELGPGSSLGPGVDCYNMALISIGARTIVSQRAFLCGGTHDISGPEFQLIARPITIGSDVWIASEAFVGPGVTVADGCVLGARGCAFSDLDGNMVYRGNPAQVVKERRRDPIRAAERRDGPMRITCVLGPFAPVPPVWGGAVERIWLNLCEEFAARGHSVIIISRRFVEFPDREILNGVHHIRLKSFNAPKQKVLYRFLDVIFSLRVCWALPKSDVTITNSVSLPLIIPHSRAGKIYMSIARFPKGQMGFYRRADRMQPVSSHVAAAIKQQSPSVASLIKVVPNAISETFAAFLDEPRHPRSKQIVFVGRIAKEKGIDLLIRGFAAIQARHPDWKLTVVGPHLPSQGGDGENFLAELKQMAERLKAPVSFIGPVFNEVALAQHLRESEIFVYPSVAGRGEALPLAPVEAMACGCAVLVSALACFDDYLIDGENGLTFDQQDASGGDLGSKLELMLGNDALRHQLGASAIATARRYTRASVAVEFLQDFETIVHGTGADR